MSPTIHAYSGPVALSTGLRSQLRDGHSKLRTTTHRSGSTVVVYTAGEVDAANVDIWRRLVWEAAAAVWPPGCLVIDTNELDFMGCCAYAVLAEEADRCRRRGIELCLVSQDPIVARVVTAGRLGSRLQIHTTVDEAVSRPELLANA